MLALRRSVWTVAQSMLSAIGFVLLGYVIISVALSVPFGQGYFYVAAAAGLLLAGVIVGALLHAHYRHALAVGVWIGFFLLCGGIAFLTWFGYEMTSFD